MYVVVTAVCVMYTTSCLRLVCIMCSVVVRLRDYANETHFQKARRTELSVTAGFNFDAPEALVVEQ